MHAFIKIDIHAYVVDTHIYMLSCENIHLISEKEMCKAPTVPALPSTAGGG